VYLQTPLLTVNRAGLEAVGNGLFAESVFVVGLNDHICGDHGLFGALGCEGHDLNHRDPGIVDIVGDNDARHDFPGR